ncbi:HNH endonuclease signature motif containing protein [Actinomycetota bacterium]
MFEALVEQLDGMVDALQAGFTCVRAGTDQAQSSDPTPAGASADNPAGPTPTGGGADGGLLASSFGSAGEFEAVVAAAQRVLNAAEGLQLAAIAQRARIEVDAPETFDESTFTTRDVVHQVGHVEADAVDTIALVTGATCYTAGSRVGLATRLASAFPATLAQIASGGVDRARAVKLSRAAEDLPAGVCQDIDSGVSDRLPVIPADRVGTLVREAVEDHAPGQAQRLRAKNTTGRRVAVAPGPDGMSLWDATLPTAVSARMWACITTLADTYTTDDPTLTADAARADALADLVLGNATITAQVTLGIPITRTPQNSSVVPSPTGTALPNSTPLPAGSITVPTGGSGTTGGTGTTGGSGTVTTVLAPTPTFIPTTAAPTPPTGTTAAPATTTAPSTPAPATTAGTAPETTAAADPEPATPTSGAPPGTPPSGLVADVVWVGVPATAPIASPQDDPDGEEWVRLMETDPLVAQLINDRLAGRDALGDYAHCVSDATAITIAQASWVGPAEVPGVGVIDAQTVALILAGTDTTVSRALFDAHTGCLLETTTPAYRPTRAIREFVTTRDRTCRFPGCSRKAITHPGDGGACGHNRTARRRADLDHVTPWSTLPGGGTTSPADLACLCRRHHRLKQRQGWKVTLTPEGTITWTTPTGTTITTEPDHAMTTFLREANRHQTAAAEAQTAAQAAATAAETARRAAEAAEGPPF